MSALTKLCPALTTLKYARLSNPKESASCQRGSLDGNIVPMSPRPAAPRMASMRACATASPSECPARPRGWGMSTPPRISLRVPSSAKRCESYPIPTRISHLEDPDREMGGVLGVVDADAGHRHPRWQLGGGEQGVEAVQGPHREWHPDHGQIRERGGEPRQRRRQPGARDDHLEALPPGPRDEPSRLIGLAVRRGDVALVADARLREDLEGGFDARLVRFRAHEDQHVRHGQAASSMRR